MPFKSEKQRRWMHANEPAMAARWEGEEKSLAHQVRGERRKSGKLAAMTYKGKERRK